MTVGRPFSPVASVKDGVVVGVSPLPSQPRGGLLVPVVRVRRGGRVFVVNHDAVEVGDEIVTPEAEHVAPPPAPAVPDIATLALLSMAELKRTPEWLRAAPEQRERARSKNDVIRLIREVAGV